MMIIGTLLMLVLLYYFPSETALKLLQYDKRHSKCAVQSLSMGEKVACCIPLWQCVVTRQTLRKKAGIVKPMAIIAAVLICAGMFLELFCSASLQLTLIGLALLILGVLIHQLVYIITYFDIAVIFDFGIVYKVLALLIPELTAYYCVTAVPRALSDLDKRLQVKYSAH